MREIGPALLVCLAQWALGKILVHQDQQAWLPVLLSITPVLWAYLLLRFVLPPVATALLVLGTDLALHMAHHTKSSLTGEPLSWSDLSQTDNLGIVGQYITPLQAMLALALLLGLMAWTRLEMRGPFVRTGLVPRAMGWLLLTPLALQPWWPDASVRLARWLDQPAPVYVQWNWASNVQANGLALHLLQTSKRPMPARASAEQRAAFAQLQAPLAPAAPARPSHIITILCEACWHDARLFREAFEPLRAQGMREFRAVSPAYGGGTVNAAFEMLTGLPSRGVLSGIIYQEYKTQLSAQALAWPRQLHQQGYKSVAMHNHARTFWQRHVVNPKLGFDAFLGREDLNIEDPAYFADDRYLFDAAWQQLQSHPGQPMFMHLTTVYTHGPYPPENDHGERNYARRLTQTLQQTAAFVHKVTQRHPDALILLVGDHKPALTRYLFKHGVLTPQQFETTGDTDDSFVFDLDHLQEEVVGDVPGYIYHRDAKQVQTYLRRIQGLPMFCMTQIADELFVRSGLPAFEYARRQGLCDWEKRLSYDDSVAAYPGWLYDQSLFAPR